MRRARRMRLDPHSTKDYMTGLRHPISIALDLLAKEEIPMHAHLHVTLLNGTTLSGAFKALSGNDGFYTIHSRGADQPTVFHAGCVVTANASIPS